MWPFSKKKTEPQTQEVAQLRESLLESQTKYRLLFNEGAKDNNILDAYHVAAAYGSVYTKVSQSRKELIKAVDRVCSFYLCMVIIDQLVEDSLSPQTGTGDVLDVSSPNPEIDEILHKLDEKVDFDLLALSVAPELIKYGEYVLRTIVKASPEAKRQAQQFDAENESIEGEESKEEFGIQEIIDDVDQGNVVSLTKYSNIEGYLVVNKNGGIEKKEPADFIKFSLSSTRLRVDLRSEFQFNNDSIKDVPRFVRVGRSIIHPIIAKLKELELLEALVPASKLNKLSSGSLIGLQVPPGYEIEKAMQFCKTTEGLINKKVGVDEKHGELSIQNIMAAAGKYKVVPIFGDKGQIQKFDYKSNEPDDLLSAIRDVRETILSSAGVPYEIVFGDEGKNKGQILKKYARYLRKLKAIQKSIEEGVRNICYIELANKGVKFTSEDIKVEFHNKLVEIDKLDHLEFVDTTIQFMKNVTDFVGTLNQEGGFFSGKVNMNELAKFVNENMNMVGFNDLIVVEDVEKDAPEKGEFL